MAKTNPIGVRFDPDIYNMALEKGGATSYQSALVLYEKLFKEHIESKSQEADISSKSEPPAGLSGIELTIWKSQQKKDK